MDPSSKYSIPDSDLTEKDRTRYCRACGTPLRLLERDLCEDCTRWQVTAVPHHVRRPQ